MTHCPFIVHLVQRVPFGLQSPPHTHTPQTKNQNEEKYTKTKTHTHTHNPSDDPLHCEIKLKEKTI